MGILQKLNFCKSLFYTDNKFAFTLAEVLITLGIIGVIAAITIPVLMKNAQDKELAVGLKKAYSQLSSATISTIHDNGDSFIGINDAISAYSPYLKIIKTCNSDARGEGCWHPDNGTWKLMDGSSTSAYTIGPGFVLSDGELVNFANIWSDCDNSSYYNSPSVCGWVVVDVNGFKPPNTTGRDIFYFFILQNKLEPWGSDNSNDQTCGAPGDTSGLFCAASKLNQ